MMTADRKIKFRVTCLSILFLVLLGHPPAHAFFVPKQFSFDTQDSLNEWEEKIFKGRVLYTVRADRKLSYLNAYSKSSASGIVYRLKFDPRKEPMASWRWKVNRFPDKTKQTNGHTNSTWIERDDYAARFYVIFPSMIFILTKSLEYVWDEDIPAGTVMASPYFSNIKLMVLESGDKNLGKWVYEERNIYQDYRRAFGIDPGRVGAIAIMTDTDNTLSTAEAEYDEIEVGYKNGAK
jgi:hypothetical protein